MNHKKFKPQELNAVSLLLHSVRILDKAATIAINNESFEDIVTVYEKMLDASDRLTTIVFNLEESEEINVRPEQTQQFGFAATRSTPTGGDFDAPNGEPGGL